MSNKILIVEDNALLAADLAYAVRKSLGLETHVVARAQDGIDSVTDDVLLGFLDIEVLDGTTFPLASYLKQKHIPFLFVSANDPRTVPQHLSDAPFLQKPLSTFEAVAAARRCLKMH